MSWRERSKAETIARSFEPMSKPKAYLIRRLSEFRVRIRRSPLFRRRRLRQWLAVLSEGRRRLQAADLALMVWLVVRSAWRPTDPRKVRSNYSKCGRCPMFDRRLKRCGDGDGFGCGCFQVFAVAFDHPCWIRQEDPESEFGYDT